jgi:hypothetical protein
MVEMHNWIKSEQDMRANLGEEIKSKIESRTKLDANQENDSRYFIPHYS